MNCSYCGAKLREIELSNKHGEMIFCDTCLDKINQMSPDEEKIQEKYIDPDDGQVYYY